MILNKFRWKWEWRIEQDMIYEDNEVNRKVWKYKRVDDWSMGRKCCYLNCLNIL